MNLDIRTSSEKIIEYRDNDFEPKYEQLKKNYASLELYNRIIEDDLHETTKDMHKEYAERIKLESILLDIVSHDSRNALHNISGNIALISIQNVQNNNATMAMIDYGISQLLEHFDRISNLVLLQTNKYELSKDIVLLPDIIAKLNNSIEQYVKVTDNQNLLFNYSLEKNSNTSILCDENAIFLLLQNICYEIFNSSSIGTVKVLIKSNIYTRHTNITFELDSGFPINNLKFLNDNLNDFNASQSPIYSVSQDLVVGFVELLDCSFYVKQSAENETVSFVLTLPY